MESPCKDCLDRKIGCHSDCEKYVEYKSRINNQFESEIKNCSPWRMATSLYELNGITSEVYFYGREPRAKAWKKGRYMR